jgi:hypothetical protein
LFATALGRNSSAGQVSAALAGSTLRAAVKVAAGEGAAASVASAEVAARVEGASKTMFYRFARIATVLWLAVCVVAVAVFR